MTVRSAARLLGSETYNTGKPCIHGHLSDRYVRNGMCIRCSRDYHTNPEYQSRKRAHGRNHYANNKEFYRERTKKWRQNNPHTFQDNSRKYRASVKEKARSLFSAAKNRAIKRNWDFSISVEWIIERLTTGECEVSKLPFIFRTEGNGSRNPYAPSLDRIDSSKGYTMENCRIILWALNMAFATWGETVYKNIAAHVVLEYDL